VPGATVVAETGAVPSRISTSYKAVSLGTIFASLESGNSSNLRSRRMGDVIRFVPKAELERARLIREARANYERIFPQADPAAEREAPNK
jgi:hypothetical protein